LEYKRGVWNVNVVPQEYPMIRLSDMILLEMVHKGDITAKVGNHHHPSSLDGVGEGKGERGKLLCVVCT
jgi:hypothetical protein